MTLWEEIVAEYPELTPADFGCMGSIELKNDGDGSASYINKWEYSKPIPSGLKLGK
jgi:hypothetical protein